MKLEFELTNHAIYRMKTRGVIDPNEVDLCRCSHKIERNIKKNSKYNNDDKIFFHPIKISHKCRIHIYICIQLSAQKYRLITVVKYKSHDFKHNTNKNENKKGGDSRNRSGRKYRYCRNR